MASFKEIISTLPRRKGWNDSDNDLFLYRSFYYYSFFIEGVMSAQQNFQSQPSDIIICSASKTRTTWLKSLTFAIVTRTTFDDSTNPLLTNLSHDCVPLLEVDLAQSSTNRDPKNPLSIIDSSGKIVYICRDPKDSFVSLYHFIARRLASKDMKPLALEEAFELYCGASLDRPDKILFLKYEEMIEDTILYIKKIADFIGYPFSFEEIEKGSVEKIVNMCSFENLSNLEVNKSGKHRKVGDWENYLTPEMAARLDSITLQKLNGSGLTL
ncbi:hypothetical protein E1A91_D01G248900v1 [Gossypium mustelinum]|uniref:Sulfotransferase n=1 Tax=Gossypium mustelinum TaxID=34275 RepID=A0A5D2WAL2_GOSMU|nr:hypothetical protein E1A91_D01G248900v1 [Gossypium mustelinum]